MGRQSGRGFKTPGPVQWILVLSMATKPRRRPGNRPAQPGGDPSRSPRVPRSSVNIRAQPAGFSRLITQNLRTEMQFTLLVILGLRAN